MINPDSICFFIPQNIFKTVGGLDVILSGNFLPSKLPINYLNSMSKHSWPGNCDLCIFFSPHRMKIWNNELITVKGKSLFFEKWLDHGLMYLSYLFDSSLRIYSYDSFFVYVQLSYKI